MQMVLLVQIIKEIKQDVKGIKDVLVGFEESNDDVGGVEGGRKKGRKRQSHRSGPLLRRAANATLRFLERHSHEETKINLHVRYRGNN